jgi:GT2 family glycosyltransferase
LALKVSLIIINFNGKTLLDECFHAIKAQTFRDFETIVVDNASSDGSAEAISSLLPEARLIRNRKNVGFSGGLLMGFENAAGDYISVLNNDVIIDPSWLGKLVKAMDEHPEAGICASKIMAYGTDIIDSAGDGYSTVLKGFKRGEREHGTAFERPEYVFGACAGAALYRRRMIEETGFFDKDFFLIHEDTDMNLRAQIAGWKVLFVPDAVVYHKVRSTIGHMSDTAVYYTLRNNEFVRMKNVPIGIIFRYLPLLIIYAFMEFVFFSIRHRRFGLYVRAKADALRYMPAMLRKRSEVMKTKRVNNSYLRSIITPVRNQMFFSLKMKDFIQR